MTKSIKVTNIRHGNPGVSGWYAILQERDPADVLEKDINSEREDEGVYFNLPKKIKAF